MRQKKTTILPILLDHQKSWDIPISLIVQGQETSPIRTWLGPSEKVSIETFTLKSKCFTILHNHWWARFFILIK